MWVPHMNYKQQQNKVICLHWDQVCNEKAYIINISEELAK